MGETTSESAEEGASARPRWCERGLLAGAYVGACLLFTAGGHQMRIPWVAYQLLDRELLAQHPLQSLLLLHAQPPLLNLLLAGILALSSTLGVSPETLALLLFVLVGAVAVLGIWELTLVVTASQPLAWTAVAITLVAPGFRHFQHMFFYTFVVAALLPLLLLWSARYLERGRSRDLTAVTACLVVVPHLRTLYPPLWSLLFLALLLGLRGLCAGGVDRRAAAASIAILALLLALWPLKNQVVFGEFTYSSWSGYNLARRTPDGARALLEFWEGGPKPPGMRERIADVSQRFGDTAIAAIRAPLKSDGSANWNHVVMLATREEMGRQALEWRLRHPGASGRFALEHYFMWSRPTWVHPYLGFRVTPDLSGIDVGIGRVLETIFFPDLRGAVEGLLPAGRLDGFALAAKRKVPFTLFGVLFFPGIVIGAAVLLLRRWPWRSTAEGVVALSLFCILWSLALPCFVDGIEGNRMRYTTGGLLTVVALYFFGVLRTALAARSAAAVASGTEPRGC